MKKYGYFGEGLEGYMHYMQSFEDNSTSGSSNINVPLKWENTLRFGCQ